MAAVRTLSLVGKSPSLIGEGELTRRRILRALEQRERYRYVHPEVSLADDGWLITSPCCSRNVDPEGGVIDIARVTWQGRKWRLFARDARRQAWELRGESARFDELMATLCRDPERVFWP